MTGLRTETGKPDKLSCRAEDRPSTQLFDQSAGCDKMKNAPSHHHDSNDSHGTQNRLSKGESAGSTVSEYLPASGTEEKRESRNH